MSLALLSLATKRFEDLTEADVLAVMSVLGVKSKPSADTLLQIRDVLREENIDKLGELLSKPTVMERLKAFVKGAPMPETAGGVPEQSLETVHQCGFCGNFSLVKIRVS